jgi:serine/threonine-protein kinase
MAEVFLARQSGMDGFEKPVVIKRILPHLSGEQQFVDMFLNEAKVAARLSHPSIVQIFDFGRIDGQYFIAMEFIHGEDLRSLAKMAERKGKRPSMALTARVIADVLGGLHYAHTRSGADGRRLGLVHRDISPQNVLVTFEGGVKLVDFGIAKATESQQGQQTQAGLLKGKYAYMSPEQCRGHALDARSDVFAVGILLWELLTWKRLFRRESDLATLVAVADEPIPRVSQMRPDVAPELDRVCTRALARSLDERYPSAQAMQADLEAVIRRYGWEADSIRLQHYMRDVFADKLALQDEAIRAAGLGSIEDFLVRVEEGTRMAWIEDGDRGGQTPAGLELPSVGGTAQHTAPTAPVRPTPSSTAPVTTQQLAAQRGVSAQMAIAPVPNWPPQQTLGASGDTGSTLRGSAGQVLARRSSASMETVLPPARWKRVAVVASTGLLVVAAGLGALFWPATDAPQGAAAGAPMPRIHVFLDQPGTVYVDGVAQPAGAEAEVAVAPRVEHQLRVTAGSVERRMTVPPLEPGAVQPIRMKLAQ